MKITTQYVLEHPEEIKHFTADQINETRTLFHNKRSSILRDVVRPALDARERELNENAKAAETAKNIFRKVKSMWDRVGHLYLIDDAQDHISLHARSISNDLHDVQEIWSGYESVSIVEMREKKGRVPPSMICNEHYYPRQLSGTNIVNKILTSRGSYSFNEFCADVCEACHVHRVTPEENQKLRPYQVLDSFTNPRKSYLLAGVELMKVVEDTSSHLKSRAWRHLLESIH